MFIRDDFTDCDTDVRLDGKTAVVTGGTAGIGFEVAKNLANRGAKVIIAARNATKLDSVTKDIIKATGNTKVIGKHVDFESLTSVRNFVGEMNNEPFLDILINNIGAFALQDKYTEDGLQLSMQVNYFGSFLLTFLLFPLMKRSAPSRIVNVASFTLIFGDIDFDRWNNVGQYSISEYYSNAKLADVLFTVEMNKRINGSGVSVYSTDPGMAKSDIFKDANDIFYKIIGAVLQYFGRPLDRVATMPVYLAVNPKLENQSGKHFRDCKEFYSSWHVSDAVLTKTLWEKSKKLVKIKPGEDWERKN